MKDPMKDVVTKVKGATYMVPVYEIGKDGVEHNGDIPIQFCKGAKNDESVFRQPGFFTESLLTACRHYLTDVNEGDLRNPLTTQAITRIDEAIQLLRRRSQQRAAAGVQNTMSPVGQIPTKGEATVAPHPLFDDADKQKDVEAEIPTSPGFPGDVPTENGGHDVQPDLMASESGEGASPEGAKKKSYPEEAQPAQGESTPAGEEDEDW